jgi:hypothetical protein
MSKFYTTKLQPSRPTHHYPKGWLFSQKIVEKEYNLLRNYPTGSQAILAEDHTSTAAPLVFSFFDNYLFQCRA